MEASDFSSEEGSRGSINDYLASQKQSGCNILLTGDVSVTAVARLVRRLMGDTSIERQRILALSNWDCQDINMLLPVGIDATDPTVRIVGCDEMRQSLAHSSVVKQSRTVITNEDCLNEFSDAIHATINMCQSPDEQCNPGELRLCVATLSSLISRFGIKPVEVFCQTVLASVKDNCGIGMYYLPETNDSESISALSSYHDIQVEMKEQKRNQPKHRWRILDSDYTTEWMTLSPPS
jgi:hypothetical protein